jgi:FHA domain
MSLIRNVLNFFSGRLNLPLKSRLSEKTLTWTIKKKGYAFFAKNPSELGVTKILKREGIFTKEARWIFKIVAGADQGREYVAITKEIRVGRHPENLILLRDPKVSRFHAIFHRKGSRLLLEDLGSTNGTRVNGELVIKKKVVFSGDQIKIGETLIRVILEKG